MEGISLTAVFITFMIDITAGSLNDHALRDLINQVKKGGKPLNHDLQKALKRSVLLALQNITLDCHKKIMGESPQKFTVNTGGNSYMVDLTSGPFKNIAGIIKNIGNILNRNSYDTPVTISPVYPPELRYELEWLNHKCNQLAMELKRVKKEKPDEKFLASFDRIETFLGLKELSSDKKMQSVKEELIAEALKDGTASECYEKIVREELFKLSCDHFVWEIKYNQVIFNIFVVQSLLQISSGLRALHSSTQTYEAKAEIILYVDIDELSSPHLREAVEHLKKLGKCVSLRIRGIEAGSVTLILEGSRDGFERLESLFKSGQLTEISGIPVKNISARRKVSLQSLHEINGYTGAPHSQRRRSAVYTLPKDQSSLSSSVPSRFGHAGSTQAQSPLKVL